MKKYRMDINKASIVIIEAIGNGIPEEHFQALLDAANSGYMFGYADQLMGVGKNETEYGIDEVKLHIVAIGTARGN